ncbi:MAG: DUF502 domain-containing protein [Armatimonadetes bacterium]|nr:DUF502 domain-containing protein [Armatimonadota bacterium]MDW8028528.1 DUF502 domain-containing protein [Armatimonadota bacterium]
MQNKPPTRFRLLRRYFLTGVAFVAPVALTIFIFGYLFQLLHNWIGRPISRLLPERLVAQDGSAWVASVIGLLLLLGGILVVGAMVSTMLGRRLVDFSERVLLQLPLVRTVYAPAKQIVEFFVNPTAVQFGAVVLVRYPHPNSYAIGFVTGKNVDPLESAINKRLVNVFVPFTPTPVTGIMLVLPEDEIIPVDLTVEEALKMVVSGGVVTPIRDLAEVSKGKSETLQP